MGLGFQEGKVKSWNTCKSKERKKKKNSEKEDLDDEAAVEETGCWVKLRFIGSCISSRSKVDSSVSGTSTNYGILFIYFVLAKCYSCLFSCTLLLRL